MSKLACLSLLALLAFAPGTASAEVATGCLNMRTGQIYNLKARSDTPMKKCRKQHPQIRLQLGTADPPPSAAPSDNIVGSRTIEFGEYVELASFQSEPTEATIVFRYDDLQWPHEEGELSPICHFYIWDEDENIIYELARIPEGRSMSGIRTIEIFLQDDWRTRDTVNSTGTVKGQDWEAQVFTLEVSSTRDTCSARWEMDVEN